MLHERRVSHKWVCNVIHSFFVCWCYLATFTLFKLTINILRNHILLKGREFIGSFCFTLWSKTLGTFLLVFFCWSFVYFFTVILWCNRSFSLTRLIWRIALFIDIAGMEIWWGLLLLKVKNWFVLTIGIYCSLFIICLS